MVSPSAVRPEPEAARRVFLSHSTHDAAFVQRLADGLTGAGFIPWLCEVDIETGANFVSRINDGLAQSDVALLVWSPDAARSSWTEQEWTSLLARQVEEHKIRLAIVMLREHPLPPLLRTSNYIDARYDQSLALRRTVEWLKKREAVQRLAGLRAPVYLPDYRPQDFVGRGAYLEKLRATFAAEPSAFLLHGEPGAGKSTLALRFAWEAQKDFDAVIFQVCGQRPLDAITAELTDRLPIDVKLRPPDEQRAVAKEWLRERQSLLILDDVWSPEVKQLEPGPSCCVLYTSRSRSLPWIPPAETVPLEKFTEAEAEELFHTYLDSTFGESEVTRRGEALLGFARQVELLPIAVSVGANMLRQRSASALPRALLKIRLDNLTDGAKDVNALFAKAIEIRPESEQKLLNAGAICMQEGFWLPLVAEIAGLSEDDAEDAADQLVHCSMMRVIDRERRRFNLHALLRDQLQARLSADDLAGLQGRHAASLERLFEDRETRWRDCRECLDEIIPAAEFLWDRGNASRQSWMTYYGYALGKRIGELDAALRILQQEESFWTERDDVAAKDALQRSYGNQALILYDWGRLEEAMALHKNQEAICLELGDKNGLQASYGNQALILQAWGRLEEAMALHKKKEAICLELGSKNSLQISYGNQALILQAWGRLEEAMALHKMEEAICLELGNKDSLQRSYGNQALILQAWGRLEEAMALHKKKEAICLELGNKDGLQASYGNQALILQDWGRLEEAMELLKKQEAICLELGDKDSLQRSYGNQALILQDWGRLEEAMELLKKQESICLELGNKNSLQASYGNQALILQDWGRLEEAMALLKKQEAICLELGNRDNLAISYGSQADILRDQGKLDEALELYKKKEALSLELGKRDNLGYCYWASGRLAGKKGDLKTAKEKLQQALAIFTELKMPLQRDAVQAELDKLTGELPASNGV